MPSQIHNEQYWRFITNRIKNRKCVLMIGPGLATDVKGNSVTNLLEEYLAQQGKSGFTYPKEEFFSFKNEGEKKFTYFEIQEFYNQKKPTHNHLKIVDLPFHLIVSMSPDLLLKKAFQEKGIAYSFEYYKKYENPHEPEKPSPEKTLIYNLLGSVTDDESLVYTYDDLFDYLIAIFGEFRLPETLKNELKTADTFIFLGLKFEKWYLKLLLRLLELHQNKLIHATSQLESIGAETRAFYNEVIKIEFVEEDIDQYIEALHTACKKAELLRSTAEVVVEKGPPTMSEQIKKKIEDDEITDAIDMLKEAISKAEDDDLEDVITLQSSRYKRLTRKIDSNTISDSEADIETNKIKEALLSLAKEIKEFD